MIRLIATIGCDLRLQFRNGFYYASAVVVVGMVVLLRWLPEDAVAWLLPVVLLQNVLMNTFYFVAGLILLEKTEGTLEAQQVTPLRSGEYLASKVITLGALSMIESFLITAFARGIGPGFVPLAVGIALASALFCLVGIVLVTRYDSINEYLLPSVAYTFVLSLPLLGYFGFGARVLYDWHPLQGPLALMSAGAAPLSAERAVYAVVYPLVFLGPVYYWTRRALRRSILR